MADFNFSDRSVTDVLLSYASYKGKITRSSGKISTSISLLNKSFSTLTADLIEKELDKCETWIDSLSQIADWLVVQKEESGKDHITEVSGYATALAKSNDNFLKIMHVHTEGHLMGPRVQNKISPNFMKHFTFFRAFHAFE